MKYGKILGPILALFLWPSAVSAQQSAAASRSDPPLVKPGPQPPVAILFVGNLNGVIEPCQ